jgi:hypothetical protein
MDSQVTRSRQRILESAVVLLKEGKLPGQLVEAAAAAARVPQSAGSLRKLPLLRSRLALPA